MAASFQRWNMLRMGHVLQGGSRNCFFPCSALFSPPKTWWEGLVLHDGIWLQLDEKEGVHASLNGFKTHILLLGDKREVFLFSVWPKVLGVKLFPTLITVTIPLTGLLKGRWVDNSVPVCAAHCCISVMCWGILEQRSRQTLLFGYQWVKWKNLHVTRSVLKKGKKALFSSSGSVMGFNSTSKPPDFGNVWLGLSINFAASGGPRELWQVLIVAVWIFGQPWHNWRLS